jgi:hypothetical protein
MELRVFDRLSRSWTLVKASASVLEQDRMLLLFPLFSLGAMVVVLACFAAPVIGLGALDGFSRQTRIAPAAWVVAFLFYFSQYFVIFFFNAGLVGAAMMRLDGGDPTFSDGMRIATSKLGVIVGYALVAATVGLVLRAIQERVGIVGRIVVAFLGAGWSLATFLVVPVLVAEDVGPIEAVKESAGLLKRTWGENLIGRVGLTAAFGVIFLAAMACGGLLVAAAIAVHSIVLTVLALVATLLALGVIALVQTALAGIYEAALYRFATTGEGTAGFETRDLQLAFAPK